MITGGGETAIPQPDLAFVANANAYVDIDMRTSSIAHRRHRSSLKPPLSRGSGYDTFSNTSASHCG